MSEPLKIYLNVLSKFPIKEKIIDVQPIGNGHINDTLGVTIETRDGQQELKYVLQRINTEIFKDVETLQNNIFRVTTHIARKLKEKGEENIERKTLTFLHASDGRKYYFDSKDYWRVAYYIPNSVSYDTLTPELAYTAGKAFGEFQSMLADLPEDALVETIPNFHNMEYRLEDLEQAIREDKAGRAEEVKDLIAEIRERAPLMVIQEEMHKEGKLPKRTNHCDTKVNNILFDKTDDHVITVVDLDTVMPGYVLSDIGDFIRTGTNTGKEDEEDLSKVGVDMEIFKAYTKGYMETAQSFLTPEEIKLLPYGGRLLTYMQTVRFLTDYLNGDTYYKTSKPKHNLIRARAQMELLKRLEEKESEMDTFMQQWL